jgi:hypothetical protein
MRKVMERLRHPNRQQHRRKDAEEPPPLPVPPADAVRWRSVRLHRKTSRNRAGCDAIRERIQEMSAKSIQKGTVLCYEG